MKTIAETATNLIETIHTGVQLSDKELNELYSNAINETALGMFYFGLDLRTEKELISFETDVQEMFALISDVFEKDIAQVSADIMDTANALPMEDIAQAKKLKDENKLN